MNYDELPELFKLNVFVQTNSEISSMTKDSLLFYTVVISWGRRSIQ